MDSIANADSRAGFSLVELSIVLVILGLLVGGVLGGQALIKAAELRKVTASATSVQTALNAFRGRFNSLPGDTRLATRIWGAANTSGAGGQCANPLTDAGTGTQTCNGNGNGFIDQAETYRFWQHLSNAGLIEGQYTGVSGPDAAGGRHDVMGTNVPALGVNNGGLVYQGLYQVTLDTYFGFNLKQGNYLLVAGCCQPVGRTLEVPFMNAADVWSLDTKMDDGKPYNGVMQVMKGYWSGCTTALAATAEYSLGNTGNHCSFTLGIR